MKKKLLVGLGLFVVALVIVFKLITNGISEGKRVMVMGIDLTMIVDGDYTGTYTQGRWTNTVTVHIENKEIMEIKIDQDVVASGITHCSEEIFQRVIQAQSTQVDVVAGATVTSKAYLKAIEAALAK